MCMCMCVTWPLHERSPCLGCLANSWRWLPTKPYTLLHSCRHTYLSRHIQCTHTSKLAANHSWTPAHSLRWDLIGFVFHKPLNLTCSWNVVRAQASVCVREWAQLHWLRINSIENTLFLYVHHPILFTLLVLAFAFNISPSLDFKDWGTKTQLVYAWALQSWTQLHIRCT